MKLRSPIDIEADYDVMTLHGFPDHDETKQLLMDTKRLLKNEEEYLSYLVESGQTYMIDALDRDILRHKEIVEHLSNLKSI